MALGVSFQQVQKYEKAANRISCSMLANIAEILGAHPGEFFPAPEGPGDEASPTAPGSRELAQLFNRMTPAQQTLILGMARELAA